MARDRPAYVRDQPTTVFPPEDKQDRSREPVRHQRAIIDTTLSAAPSSVERDTYAEIEQMFNRHALETQLTENQHESEMELQPWGKYIGIR